MTKRNRATMSAALLAALALGGQVREVRGRKELPIIYPKTKIYEYNNEPWRKQGKRKMKVR